VCVPNADPARIPALPRRRCHWGRGNFIPHAHGEGGRPGQAPEAASGLAGCQGRGRGRVARLTRDPVAHGPSRTGPGLPPAHRDKLRIARRACRTRRRRMTTRPAREPACGPPACGRMAHSGVQAAGPCSCNGGRVCGTAAASALPQARQPGSAVPRAQPAVARADQPGQDHPQSPGA
jgi:hypothetical protein